MATKYDYDFNMQGVARILNLPNAVDNQEPVTLAQLTALLINLPTTGKSVKTIGDGVSTSIVVNHGLKTQDVLVQVRLATAPFTIMYPSNYIDEPTVQATSKNTVTCIFNSAPAVGQYRVVVMGVADVVNLISGGQYGVTLTSTLDCGYYTDANRPSKYDGGSY